MYKNLSLSLSKSDFFVCEINTIFAIAMKKIHNFLIIFSAFVLFFGKNSFAQNTSDTLKIVQESSIAIDSTKPFVPYKNSQQVDNIISYAKKFLGTPYRYSGTTPSGFDCSGFINYIFGNFGFELTRTSYGLAEYGKTVKLADIRPGDLMFFKGSSTKSNRVGHVAMVVEVSPAGIKFIHSSTSKGVTIDNFNGSKYYVPRYITTKRLDYGVTEETPATIIEQK